MTQTTYSVRQWELPDTKNRPNTKGKWYITGYGLLPDKPTQQMFLRKDGTWQHVMYTDWLPDGGTYFDTKNEAEVALALTGGTDHTEQNSRRYQCRPR